MAVPENIRKVPRPVNTIVEDNGRFECICKRVINQQRGGQREEGQL
ncbi:MAG: hypothetical protein LUI10_03275 [Lachnospiraceae bacterium]|nr:hypothetical protein [Lachnospiraceae bacterium]